jgi:CDP-4-dehydro-6-deoxyglucose reductase
MLRVMSAHVTVKPSGREFFVEGSETLLKAALRAGLTPNYGCGNGVCGLCKARVVEGEARAVSSSEYRFSAAEKAQNHVLMCACTALSSDLVLEVLEAGAPEDIPEQRIVAKVRSIDVLSDEVMRLHLQTPRSNRLRFLAGQRVTLGASAGVANSSDIHGEYPVASCPCDDRNLIFHICRADHRSASADFSQCVVDGRIKPGDDVSVWGPWGSFVLEKGTVRPLVFIAIDAGFAPVNSLIEHAIAVDAAESITLYWASSQPGGQYLPNQCRAWAEALDEFSYLPLATDALPATLAANASLLVSDVYLAGAGGMVESLAAALLALGVPRGQLHVEVL